MEAVEDIAIMQNTIAFSRFVLIFPSAQDIQDIGFKYYLKIALLCCSTFMFLIGCLLHIIVTCIRKTYVNLDNDLSFAVSIVGCYIYIIFYLLHIKNTVKIYKMLSDFRTYGKPDTLEDFNRKFNKLSQWHIISLIVVVAILSFSPWMEIRKCREEYVGRNRQEICGFLGGVWLPFDLTGVYKHLFFFYQAYSSLVAHVTADMVNFSIIETVEHTRIRFQHVRNKFFEAINEKDVVIRRKKLIRAIEYHIAVINLVKMINESFSACMFVYAFLTGAILGCSGHVLMREFSMSSIALLAGWLGGVAVSCSSGQRLSDEGVALGDAIYSSDWVAVDKQTRKDLITVILRCQVPVNLVARPLGTMNCSMILAILNTAYSYITFLSQTN